MNIFKEIKFTFNKRKHSHIRSCHLICKKELRFIKLTKFFKQVLIVYHKINANALHDPIRHD